MNGSGLPTLSDHCERVGAAWQVLSTIPGAHQINLADVHLKLGAYDQAAQAALEIPRSVPASARAEGCFDAARILARVVTKLSADEKLPQTERNRLDQRFIGRTAVLLREVIDTDPKLADQIKSDADIKALRSRPEFQTLMDGVIILAKCRCHRLDRCKARRAFY